MDVKTFEGEEKEHVHDVEYEIVKYIRELRHDYMNHIQVIWGYLQLQRQQDALQYISELNKQFDVFSTLFKLESPVLSLFLYNCVKDVYKKGVVVDIENEVECIDDTFTYGYDELNGLGVIFDDVVNRTVALEEKIVYIDIFEEGGTLYIEISNSRYDGDDASKEGWNTDDMAPPVKDAVKSLQKIGTVDFYRIDGCCRVKVKVGFKYR